MSGPSVRVAAGVLEAMVAHAQADAPHECCGFLIGTASAGVIRAVAATNAWEPSAERPRRYAFAPAEQVAAERVARSDNADVLGYYHSHPAAAPVPSGVDLELAWPAYSYFIIGIVENVASVRAWVLDSGGRSFIEQQIVPAESGRTL